MVTVVSLAVSAGVFAYTHLRRAPAPIVSLAVLDLSDPGGMTFLNTGNVDVLVTDIYYSTQPPVQTMSSTINKIVKHGETVSLVLDSGAYGNVVPGDPLKIVLTATKAGAGAPRLGKGYGLRWYMAGHASMRMFKETGVKTLPSQG
jgi:hypothetical protein